MEVETKSQLASELQRYRACVMRWTDLAPSMAVAAAEQADDDELHQLDKGETQAEPLNLAMNDVSDDRLSSGSSGSEHAANSPNKKGLMDVVNRLQVGAATPGGDVRETGRSLGE